MASNNSTQYALDIFISYQRDIQESVLKLRNVLTNKYMLKCWIDKHNIGTGTLYEGNQVL
jgi:hypothetical protein